MWHNFVDNQKNNRSVCAANEAGYAEYSGLPGRVKTGSPEQQSHLCSLLLSIQHVNRGRGLDRAVYKQRS